jgi:hypothetical protein
MQILSAFLAHCRSYDFAAGTQFACFTGTKVQILTQKTLQEGRDPTVNLANISCNMLSTQNSSFQVLCYLLYLILLVQKYINCTSTKVHKLLHVINSEFVLPGPQSLALLAFTSTKVHKLTPEAQRARRDSLLQKRRPKTLRMLSYADVCCLPGATGCCKSDGPRHYVCCRMLSYADVC